MNKINNLIKSNEYIILFIIVIIDLITKLMANYFLPYREYISILGEKVCLYLIYNQDFVSGQENALLQNIQNKNLHIVLTSLIALFLIGYILFIRKQKMRTFYKILMGIGLYVGLCVITELTKSLFVGIIISSWTASVVGKLAGLMVCGTFFCLCPNKWIRLSLVIIIAGGIGNLLSHFYPPFHIVDFIEIEGSYELLRIGVFNIADLAFNIGFLGLIISLLIFGIKKIITNKKRKLQEK